MYRSHPRRTDIALVLGGNIDNRNVALFSKELYVGVAGPLCARYADLLSELRIQTIDFPHGDVFVRIDTLDRDLI